MLAVSDPQLWPLVVAPASRAFRGKLAAQLCHGLCRAPVHLRQQLWARGHSAPATSRAPAAAPIAARLNFWAGCLRPHAALPSFYLNSACILAVMMIPPSSQLLLQGRTAALLSCRP